MKSIPTFPNFEKICLDFYDEFLCFTKQFKAYSDFNFISMYCWNVDNSVELSKLYNNIVIKLPDYITGEQVYSILGIDKIDRSINELLETTPTLKLVPEIVIRHLNNNRQLLIHEDPDNYDYIYSLDKLSSLNGREYRSKRKRLNRLNKELGNMITFEDYRTNLCIEENRIMAVFEKWAKQNHKKTHEVEFEKCALKNIISLSEKSMNIILTIMKFKDIDIGFSINEFGIPTSTCHFQKTTNMFENIDILLTNYISTMLLDLKSSYVNWEQDLGIEGLRYFKKSYNPISKLKKYTISRS